MSNSKHLKLPRKPLSQMDKNLMEESSDLIYLNLEEVLVAEEAVEASVEEAASVEEVASVAVEVLAIDVEVSAVIEAVVASVEEAVLEAVEALAEEVALVAVAEEVDSTMKPDLQIKDLLFHLKTKVSDFEINCAKRYKHNN